MSYEVEAIQVARYGDGANGVLAVWRGGALAISSHDIGSYGLG